MSLFSTLVLIFFAYSKMLLAKDGDPLPYLKLVGVIVHDQNILEKSILVIKDMRNQKTLTIVGQATIPGTSFVFKGLFRDHIMVSNGIESRRINYIEKQNYKETIAEVNQLDQLDADAIVAKTNLTWEKLEQRAETLGLDILHQNSLERERDEGCVEDCEENQPDDETEEVTQDDSGNSDELIDFPENLDEIIESN